jgi:hypothetical protein
MPITNACFSDTLNGTSRSGKELVRTAALIMEQTYRHSPVCQEGMYRLMRVESPVGREQPFARLP